MLVHCRAPVHLTAACLTSIMERKPVIMMSLMQQVLVMIEFTHVAGYSSWKGGMSAIMVVWTSYDPSGNSYWSLKQPFVTSAVRIVLLWWISSYIMSEYICAFHYLFVWSVTLLMLPNLVYKCRSLSFMEV